MQVAETKEQFREQKNDFLVVTFSQKEFLSL